MSVSVVPYVYIPYYKNIVLYTASIDNHIKGLYFLYKVSNLFYMQIFKVNLGCLNLTHPIMLFQDNKVISDISRCRALIRPMDGISRGRLDIRSCIGILM